MVFVFRQLLLGFSPMIAPDDPSVQVLYVVSTLVMYIATQCFFSPWKTFELNVLDGGSCSFLCVLLVTVGSFMEPSKWGAGHEIVMWLFLVFTIIVNVTFFGSVAASACQNGVKAEFGLQYPRSKTFEEFAREWHQVAKNGALLSDPEWVDIFVHMTNYDRRLLDKAQGVLNLSSSGKLAPESKLPRRLSSLTSKALSGSDNAKPAVSGAQPSGESAAVVDTKQAPPVNSLCPQCNLACHIEETETWM